MLYLFTIVFLIGLCWISWIDITTYRLPNYINFPLIALGLLQGYALKGSPLLYIIGALLGYSVFVMIEITFKAIRQKEGLGRGDAKLLAVGGAWCGAYALPIIVSIASLGAIVFILGTHRNRQLKIPFGPFLAAAMFSVWIFQHFG